ncbi:hypothetical protein ACFPPF_01365 [Xenophilus aerolatus]|nr:hypothetical protein [Xenophilus aerolatus]
MNSSSWVEEADYCNANAQLQSGPFDGKGLCAPKPGAHEKKATRLASDGF